MPAINAGNTAIYYTARYYRITAKRVRYFLTSTPEYNGIVLGH